jgi:hypothetical protein
LLSSLLKEEELLYKRRTLKDHQIKKTAIRKALYGNSSCKLSVVFPGEMFLGATESLWKPRYMCIDSHLAQDMRYKDYVFHIYNSIADF